MHRSASLLLLSFAIAGCGSSSDAASPCSAASTDAQDGGDDGKPDASDTDDAGDAEPDGDAALKADDAGETCTPGAKSCDGVPRTCGADGHWMAGGCTYPELVLADGPVGYWRLGEPTGAIAHDDSPSQYHGTYVGGVTLGSPGALAGDDDTAATFDGQSGRVSVGDVLDFTGLVPYSVEAWIRPTEVDDGYRRFVSKHAFASPGGERQGWELWVHATGSGDTLQIGFERVRDGLFDTASSITSLAPGNWMHVVGAFDGSTLRLYLDGSPAASTSVLRGLVDRSTPLTIGVMSTATDSFFGGGIDEVAIYPTALSEERVRLHHEAGGPSH
jgi:hypothetical protein